MFNFTGKRPNDLGLKGGRLAPCPASPNCVCSQDQDKGHAVLPLRFSGDRRAAMRRLRAVVDGMQGATVIESTDDYLRAEFKSDFFGFVDDVEFFAMDPDLIHVRSASRLGKADFGVNRKRVETIRGELGGK